MAPAATHDLKTEFLEYANQFLTLQAGKASHTEIC
jgi:hypothetical protein